VLKTLHSGRERSRGTSRNRVLGQDAGEIHNVKPFTASASCNDDQDDERASPVCHFGNFESYPVCGAIVHNDCAIVLVAISVELIAWKSGHAGVETSTRHALDRASIKSLPSSPLCRGIHLAPPYDN
jgi:hypothetical protein